MQIKCEEELKQRNKNLTFPLLVCISGGFITQESLLLPLFMSWGATDFLLPEVHKYNDHVSFFPI